MAIRNFLVMLVGAALLSLGGAASDPAPANEPWLELPQANQRVAIDSSVALDAPPSSVQQMVFHIPAGGPRVSYGTIHTKVNTESADVAMKSTSNMDGITLNVDLTGAGGFPMQPGRNSVVVGVSRCGKVRREKVQRARAGPHPRPMAQEPS